MRKIFRPLALAVMAALASGSAFAGDWKIPAPTFTDFVPGDTFYVWNIGQQGFINGGECWGTQAVINSTSGLQFTFEAQSDGGYQAKDNWGGGWNRYMFRVQTDSKAGENVHTAFVDNNGDGKKNIYNIDKVADNAYKLSMVDYDSDAEIYTTLKGEDATFNYALGVQLNHKSAYAENEANGLNGVTHALYYDIAYTGQADCQWAFVLPSVYDAWKAKSDLIAAMEEAEKNGISTTEGEAVINNASATVAEINAAITAINQAIANNVTPDNPKDYTSMIAQADCEGSTGELRAAWKTDIVSGKVQNKQSASNHAADSYNGDEGAFSSKFYEHWDPSAFAATIYQEVENVPNGVYKVQLSAFVNVADEDNATNKKQYVFFNDEKLYLKTVSGKNYIYSSILRITDNKLKIGLAQDSAIANWMGIDNAKLIYYGSGIEAAQYLSSNLLTTAESEIGEDAIYTESYMTALKSAVDAAKATTTIDDAFTAYATTKTAYDNLIANVAAYKQLNAMLESLNSAVYDELLPAEDLLDRVDQMLSNATATTEDILAEVATDKEQLDQLKKAGYKASDDVTSILVTNPNFNDATSSQAATAFSTSGWTIASGSFGGNKDMAEAFNCAFDIYQELTNVKSGAYRLDVQTFYRTVGDGITTAWEYWTKNNGEDKDENKVVSYIYAGESETPFNNIFSWAGLDAKGESGSWSEYDNDGTTKYLPNDVASAAEAFSDETHYTTSVTGIAVNHKLRIGLKNDGTSANQKYWSAWNDVKLTYLGNDISVMAPALQALVDKATALSASNMSSAAKTALNDGIATANTAIGGSDADAVADAYEALATAIESANGSITYYNALEGKLDTLSTTLEQKRETAQESAVATAENLISEVKAGLSAGSYTDEQTVTKGTEIDEATKALYVPKGSASDDNPQDYTFMITNPSFTNGSTGWTLADIVSASTDKGTSVGNNIIELWNCSGEMYQDINGLPAGTYKVTAKGFFRDSTSANAATAYANNSYETRGYMFARTQADETWLQDSVGLACIVWVDELAKSAGSAEGNWSKYIDSTDVNNQITYFFPNQRVAARERFDAGEEIYANTLYVTVPDNGFLRIGIFNHSAKVNDWLTITDWKLSYLGTNSAYAHNGTPMGINEVNSSAEIVSRDIYTIDGRKTSTLNKGLNIVRYKDANGKVTVKKILVK